MANLVKKKYINNYNKMTSIVNPITNRNITIKSLSRRLRDGVYKKNEIKLIQQRLQMNNLGYNSKTGRITKSDNRALKKQLKKEKEEQKSFKSEIQKNFDERAIKLFRNEFNRLTQIGKGSAKFNLDLFKFYSKEIGFKKILQSLPINLTNKIMIKYFDIEGNEKYYMLNDINKQKLINTFGENIFDNLYADKTESDSQILTDTSILDRDIEFLFINDNDDDDNNIINTNTTQTSIINQLLGGAMFPYLLKDDILNLDRYGIYSEVNCYNYDENCLIQSLRNSCEIEDKEIEKIKFFLKSREIPKKKLKEIANKLNICISIIQINKKKEYHGNKKNKMIELGLIENHYFIIDKKTNITSYALKNYFDENLRKKEGWNRFIRTDERTKNNFINSFRLIKYLLENKDKFLKPLPSCNELYKTSFYDKVKVQNLDAFDDDNFEKIEFIKKKDYDGNVVYFDTETNTEGKHTPYLCNCDLREQSFYGEDCGKQLLNYLIELGYREQKIKGKNEQKPLTLIAHNLGYDLSFFIKYLDKVNIVNKGNLVVVATGEYMGLKIRFIDSLMMIPMRLKDFPKTFGLDSVKEIMPYDLYTNENLNKKNGFIDIEECLKSENLINEDDKTLFLENCRKWNCIIDGKINLKLYSSKYCYIDCVVLKRGYEKFRSLMKELNGLDTLNYYSIASIAQTHLIKMGCYEGVQSISGVVREFIQKCVVGGRCMTSNNQKHIYIGKKKIKLADYDACSLYPSAMFRMLGFLMGLPKVLKSSDINDLKNNLNLFDGYFIKIKVLSVGKKYKIPCMSKVNKDTGIREWTNDMINAECYVDKTTLQDWVEFHKITFDIIEGYYYNEGRNNKINEVIKNIYDERKKYKNELSYTDKNGKNIINHYTIKQIDTKDYIKNEKKKLEESGYIVKKSNPLESVLKLIMNSGYGKSILKPIDTEEKLIPINEYHITEYDTNDANKHNLIKFKHFNDVNKTIKHLNKLSKYLEFGLDNNNKIKVIGNKKDGNYNFTYQRRYKKFINRYFNYITECSRCVDNKYMKIKMIKPIDTHFNSAHVGVEILSMSKRIMFEVMTTAEDNGLYMTYTDTDSIHIKYDDIPILEEKYFEKYNRILKGNDLGQFHIDFEMNNKDIDQDTIYSDESLFLMKKCYIDKLKGYNTKTKQWEIDYHIRMKGVPESSILLKAHQDYNDDPIELFKDLYKGTPIEFNLTKGYENGRVINKMKLEHKNYDIYSKSKFDRKITIKYNEYDELEYN